jgi:ankyrin repeat protein
MKELELLDACKKGNFDLVELLLEKGADIKAQDDKGKSAIYFACYFGFIKIVELLLDNGADITVKDKYNKTLLEVVCIEPNIV